MNEITRVSSEGKRRVVDYNELGQPIGQNATKLKKFIGTAVRFHVPITYSSWPTVPKEMKDKILELIDVRILLSHFKYNKIYNGSN